LLNGRIIVRLHAKIDNPAEPSRAHTCEFSASIVNRSPYHLLAGHVVLRGRTIDLPEMRPDRIAEVFVWSVALPLEAPSCVDKARWFQKIAREAKITACAMDDLPEHRCRKMVRVVGDFDYPALQADDFEAADAARTAAETLRAANLPVGTAVAIPPGSFFKLGFPGGDVQKSPEAKALASAQPPFDPDKPADTARMDVDSDYAAMNGPVTILAAHVDRDQAADWYKVSLWADPDGTNPYEVIAWIPRDDLDKAREKVRAKPAAPVAHAASQASD
jgi:hypothetical protein